MRDVFINKKVFNINEINVGDKIEIKIAPEMKSFVDISDIWVVIGVWYDKIQLKHSILDIVDSFELDSFKPTDIIIFDGKIPKETAKYLSIKLCN